MIAPLDAPNEFGPYDRSGKWHYFNDLTEMPDLPLEELVRKLREERATFKTTPDRLEWLKQRMARDFESARTAIVQGGNP